MTSTDSNTEFNLSTADLDPTVSSSIQSQVVSSKLLPAPAPTVNAWGTSTLLANDPYTKPSNEHVSQPPAKSTTKSLNGQLNIAQSKKNHGKSGKFEKEQWPSAQEAILAPTAESTKPQRSTSVSQPSTIQNPLNNKVKPTKEKWLPYEATIVISSSTGSGNGTTNKRGSKNNNNNNNNNNSNNNSRNQSNNNKGNSKPSNNRRKNKNKDNKSKDSNNGSHGDNTDIGKNNVKDSNSLRDSKEENNKNKQNDREGKSTSRKNSNGFERVIINSATSTESSILESVDDSNTATGPTTVSSFATSSESPEHTKDVIVTEDQGTIRKSDDSSQLSSTANNETSKPKSQQHYVHYNNFGPFPYQFQQPQVQYFQQQQFQGKKFQHRNSEPFQQQFQQNRTGSSNGRRHSNNKQFNNNNNYRHSTSGGYPTNRQIVNPNGNYGYVPYLNNNFNYNFAQHSQIPPQSKPQSRSNSQSPSKEDFRTVPFLTQQGQSPLLGQIPLQQTIPYYPQPFGFPQQPFYPDFGQEPLAPIIHQLSYYFSVENLAKDVHLRKQMNSKGFVSVSKLLEFRRLNTLTGGDSNLVLEAVKSLPSLELKTEKLRLKDNWEVWVFPFDQRDDAGKIEENEEN
ncbi:hypothetical protein WICMUC_004468 [Wickerhamomyces mucosus]|uniref:HTH La-type RNA-binding domain-containing protein n=1 Tax=Wickerhamomyces mucosus TaxID=1378264 RepID=A0A9P8PHT3_9ASCO|nr:hypothetical protein WICMUC_004468 [Wickerhamomyces mucosus]